MQGDANPKFCNFSEKPMKPPQKIRQLRDEYFL